MALAVANCLLLLQCARRSGTIEARPDPSASATADAAADVVDASDAAADAETLLSPTSWFDEKLHCVVLREILADIDTSFERVAPGEDKGPVPSGFAHCAPWRPISIHPHGSYTCKSGPFASMGDAELARTRLAEAWVRCLPSGWSRDPAAPSRWKHAPPSFARGASCELELYGEPRVTLACGWYGLRK